MTSKKEMKPKEIVEGVLGLLFICLIGYFFWGSSENATETAQSPSTKETVDSLSWITYKQLSRN